MAALRLTFSLLGGVGDKRCCVDRLGSIDIAISYVRTRNKHFANLAAFHRFPKWIEDVNSTIIQC